MLKLKRSFTDNPVVREALKKLTNTQLPSEVAYRVGRLAIRIDKEIRETRDRVLKELPKYADLDSNGVLIGINDGNFQFKSPEDKKTFEETIFYPIMEEEFEEKVLKLPLSQLGSALTPVEIMAIDELIDSSL